MGFLDNLKGTLSQGVDRAKFEADKLQRTSRVRGDIGDMQQQIATNYGLLGQRAYELHQQGVLSAPEVTSLVNLINDLQARLSAAQAELERAQNEQFVAVQTPPPPAYPQPYASSVPPQQAPYAPPVEAQNYVPPTSYAPSDAPAVAYAPPAADATADSGSIPIERSCPSCGFKVTGQGVFCPECGARL
ncbi:zinc ribbon domain-containing protein [Herpetosiphon geysericola]|uniref:Zinc-ribbon domain-containing protein n=1 Tax=Herpetosiphon geysericola TaxID=70996 RepID=A0A0P6Y2E7_9CHLR|nr:zinc ribbon domain-containing protein [Herpetosiphon geysericola]KPL91876.1 hypothetical protein SE18_00495 [Herpetosiphon geysericola]